MVLCSFAATAEALMAVDSYFNWRTKKAGIKSLLLYKNRVGKPSDCQHFTSVWPFVFRSPSHFGLSRVPLKKRNESRTLDLHSQVLIYADNKGEP